MEKKNRFLLGALLLVGAVAYLIYTGIRETSVYYLTLEEFIPKREALANQGIRIAGRVREGTLKWDPKGLEARFVLGGFKGDGPALPVFYRGILPDMFAEGRDVIVEGQYSKDTFLAHTVMTSCPSKYEPEVAGGEARTAGTS